MQKYLWSTVILMLATSVATYFAATYRSCPNCVTYVKLASQANGDNQVKPSDLKPLVLSRQEPTFIIEPIVVEPEPRPAPDCPENVVIRCEAQVQAPAPRMPYADEESPGWELCKSVIDLLNRILPETMEDDIWLDCFRCHQYEAQDGKIVPQHSFKLVDGRLVMRPWSAGILAAQSANAPTESEIIQAAAYEPIPNAVAEDVSWWKTVTNFVQVFLPLPGSDLEPVDPGIEAAKETVPPAEQGETTPQAEPKPDYHQMHPGCPYLNGCQRGYFPPPAYPFERTMPSGAPTPPPME